MRMGIRLGILILFERHRIKEKVVARLDRVSIFYVQLIVVEVLGQQQLRTLQHPGVLGPES